MEGLQAQRNVYKLSGGEKQNKKKYKNTEAGCGRTAACRSLRGRGRQHLWSTTCATDVKYYRSLRQQVCICILYRSMDAAWEGATPRCTYLASLIIDSHKCDFIIIRTLILGVKARKLNFIRWTNVVYHLLTFYYVVKTFKRIFYQGQSLKQYICCCCRILKVAPIGFGILQ